MKHRNTQTAFTLPSHCIRFCCSYRTVTLTPKIKCTAAETEIKTQTQLNFSLHSLRNFKHKLWKSGQLWLRLFDSLTVCLSPVPLYHCPTVQLTDTCLNCASRTAGQLELVCGGAASLLDKYFGITRPEPSTTSGSQQQVRHMFRQIWADER